MKRRPAPAAFKLYPNAEVEQAELDQDAQRWSSYRKGLADLVLAGRPIDSLFDRLVIAAALTADVAPALLKRPRGNPRLRASAIYDRFATAVCVEADMRQRSVPDREAAERVAEVMGRADHRAVLACYVDYAAEAKAYLDWLGPQCVHQFEI